jgi:glyoxylase-like metal-dependent hydrolase (beta-lactamase superfamily II)
MAADETSRGPGTAIEIAEGIHLIDTGFMGKQGAVGVFLIVGPDGLGLVETGPATVLETLAAGIVDAGHDIENVRDLAVTHIHLDHSGGLGELMRRHHRMRAWAHPLGVPHLVSPRRLEDSASRIYGDRMEELWGTITGVPEDRLSATEDRKEISLGGRRLKVFDSPGHASHHIVLLDEQTGTLFTGDVAGVRMEGTAFPLPPLPPPDIDIGAWKRSIALMREIGPERLVLTHFGPYTDGLEHLRKLEEALDEVMRIGRDVLLHGGSNDELTERLQIWAHDRLGSVDDRVGAALEVANPLFMSALGIHRVLRKAGELEV